MSIDLVLGMLVLAYVAWAIVDRVCDHYKDIAALEKGYVPSDYMSWHLEEEYAAEPEIKFWLWRRVDDASGEWGTWKLISDSEARRLAVDSASKRYEFVPYLTQQPGEPTDEA